MKLKYLYKMLSFMYLLVLFAYIFLQIDDAILAFVALMGSSAFMLLGKFENNK